MRKALTLVVLFAIASSAQGITIPVVGSNGDVMNIIAVSTPATTLAGASVDVWDVDLQAVSPTDPNGQDEVWAFDGTIYGDPSGSNTLYQCWAFGAVPTPTLTNTQLYLSVTAQGYDTHFDQSLADLGVATAPSETQTIVLGLPEAPHNEGWGTQLAGAFTRLATAGLQSPFQFAQVVVPSGGKFLLTGSAADGLDTGWALNHVIPEPATMALLAVGAVGLIRRRR